ncbi:hypothetical protein EVAR_20491_1 [Eumeta japonica]|uniref:Uncharacterized protein n=1 Tax=Eumeta variegata TaxID=151549 RepID=A0A4C1Y584_EUMVA|nr:hypothetical protein EVAR_20491_1 [Eumeta japonica]
MESGITIGKRVRHIGINRRIGRRIENGIVIGIKSETRWHRQQDWDQNRERNQDRNKEFAFIQLKRRYIVIIFNLNLKPAAVTATRRVRVGARPTFLQRHVKSFRRGAKSSFIVRTDKSHMYIYTQRTEFAAGRANSTGGDVTFDVHITFVGYDEDGSVCEHAD